MPLQPQLVLHAYISSGTATNTGVRASAGNGSACQVGYGSIQATPPTSSAPVTAAHVRLPPLDLACLHTADVLMSPSHCTPTLAVLSSRGTTLWAST